MIVVDANVIAYWAIEGVYTALARRLWEQEPEWIVPTLCRHELANVVASYVKHGAMDAADVPNLWEGIETVISGKEYEVNLPSTITLAADRAISAYDAQYLMLAQAKGIALVSQDKKLVGKSEHAFSLEQYLAKDR